MSRRFLMRMVVTVLIVGVLMGVAPFSALAAPPAPDAPPAPAPGFPVHHVVQLGENLFRIALRYGTTVWAIAQANGIRDVNRIRAGQCLVIPGPGHDDHGEDGHHDGGNIYIVKPGDTLSGIAWKLHVPIRALAEANHIWNYNLVYIYQKLIIP